MSILNAILEILFGGITKTAEAIGGGLSALATQIFVSGAGTTESPYTLTVFGTLIVVFAGIALALGLSRLVVNWLTGFGNARGM